MINDSISSRPPFNISIEELQNNQIIKLSVSKGKHPSCHYQNKTYKRSGSSTLEVDRIEPKRIILEGFNLDYNDIISLTIENNRSQNEPLFTKRTDRKTYK